MAINGSERMVYVTATLDEKISSKAVRLSVYGLKARPVPLQAFDAQSTARLKNAKPGDVLRLRLWQWIAERNGLA